MPELAHLELHFELQAQVLHGEALLRVDVLEQRIGERQGVVAGDGERGVEVTIVRRSVGGAGGADLRSQHAHGFLELVVAGVGL